MHKYGFGFKLGKLHNYLGRLKSDKVLYDGHNTTEEEKIKEMEKQQQEALKRVREALPGQEPTTHYGSSPIDRRDPPGTPKHKRKFGKPD